MGTLQSALSLAAALLAAQPVLAQRSDGGLVGRTATTDTVMVRRPDIGLEIKVEVDDEGRFAARHLPVGTYDVTIVHADGSEEKFLATVRIGINTRVK